MTTLTVISRGWIIAMVITVMIMGTVMGIAAIMSTAMRTNMTKNQTLCFPTKIILTQQSTMCNTSTKYFPRKTMPLNPNPTKRSAM